MCMLVACVYVFCPDPPKIEELYFEIGNIREIFHTTLLTGVCFTSCPV